VSGAPVEELEEALGYRFRDPSLLDTALAHSSYAHEAGAIESNERLEFLGDAVIGLVCAHLLYAAHPDWPEGDLTRALHALVDRSGLAALARRLDVGPHLRLGRTEVESGGLDKDSILGDGMEALLGAMYLDGGIAPVEALARRAFKDAIAAGAPRVELDPKTRFQEFTMAEFGVFPTYRLVCDSGVEGDALRFSVEACVGDDVWAEGHGRSKRVAERAAAEAAYARRADFPAPAHGPEGGADG